MKALLTNLNRLWLLLPVLFCFSCNKDQQTLDSLEGTWQLKSLTHLQQSSESLPTSGFITFDRCDQSGQANACPGTYTFGNQPPLTYQYSIQEKGTLVNFASFTSQAYEQVDKLYILQGPFQIKTRTSSRLELEGTMTIGDKAVGPVLSKVRIVLER